ncbi:unnamed protein product (macronuclear) [Paramecium tetraurelia]|uniref:Protein kinase domain-containing protein n=1 Tax=Paramecium tetraurelia TaxID=5888 RepID=A0E178_PARTE|nr:uncharacterized protein GSPATT00022214001 [Paramecium tetraurelia]CAK89045.1 unnamed protein product [Paramecium tetraurelia]|eukprot:XP_001456442.1 hypothetical protein (macronuclear) [Paramecium tetraurelia strain d4-2]
MSFLYNLINILNLFLLQNIHVNELQRRLLQQFGNKFLNPEQKGQGAFSKVYKCQNTFGEYVAIKVVNLAQAKPIVIPYLKNEVDLLRKSDNENVIKLFEAEEKTFMLYLVLEYCEFDVKSMMRTYFKNKLPEDLVIVILKQLVNGLHYLHKNNIIHRDLKLDNIGVVITPKDFCKLTTSNEKLIVEIFKNASYKLLDLGLAKQFFNKTQTQTYAGTEVNMAPEVLERKPYSFEADIYSLGVCLYQMITGEYPYYDNLNQKKQFELIKEESANFEIIENQVLRNLIQQMLKYNVAERLTFSQLYQSSYIFNSQEVIPSLLERSLIKNQKFYDFNQQIDSSQLMQNYSQVKIQQYQQFDNLQLPDQKSNSQQHIFFEKFNKHQISTFSSMNNQGNILNQQFEVRSSQLRSQIGKPKSQFTITFEKWNQRKNLCMLIQNICESLLSLIQNIPEILKYISFEGEFQTYVQYFSKLGQILINLLKEEINQSFEYQSNHLECQKLNNFLEQIEFSTFNQYQYSTSSKHWYLARKIFNLIDTIKESKEQIGWDNTNEDFQRNNSIIFRQIIGLLQSIYYQEKKIDNLEYKKLNNLNCNLYIILIKLAILQAAFDKNFQFKENDITKYSPEIFDENPDQICDYLVQFMHQYQIQYYENK